jgi:hypothetical protein
VQNYKQNAALKYSGMQEHFGLGPQVSVRTTQRKIIITVKDLWPRSFAQDPFEDIKEQGRELALRAAAQLPEIYGLPALAKSRLVFQGAEWAILEHEVAKLCQNERIKPVHREDGKVRVMVDDTPRTCVEFTQEPDARREFDSLVARSVRGLTNDELAQALYSLVGEVRKIASGQVVLYESVRSLVTVMEAQQKTIGAIVGLREGDEKQPAGSSVGECEDWGGYIG